MRTFQKIAGLLLVCAILVFLAAVWLRPRFLPVIDAPQAPTTFHLTGPVGREISASAGWQSTGVLVRPGETIRFQYVSGEIRDADSVIRGPGGAGYTCGESTCCEPIPDAPRGALIGRVGDHLFLIGDRSAVEVQEEGELQLRVNDCDAGLFDNSGNLQIKMSP
jgi:hypothetical protein